MIHERVSIAGCTALACVLIVTLGSARVEPDSKRLDSALSHTSASIPEFLHVIRFLDQRNPRLGADELAVLSRIVVTEAARARLDPALVAAMIDVESSGQRDAVSRVGALGLMQLRPTTAREVAAKAGMDWTGPEMLLDPEVNVRLGIAYLGMLVDRFGDLPTALAAYNAGPTRVARNLREGRAVPVAYADRVLAAYGSMI